MIDPRQRIVAAVVACVLVAGCRGNQVMPSGSATPTPSPSANIQGCNSTFSSGSERRPASSVASVARRPHGRASRTLVPGRVEVLVAASHGLAKDAASLQVGTQHLSVRKTLSFDRLKRAAYVVDAPVGKESAFAATLASRPGILKASTIVYRYPLTVTPATVNDPYFPVALTTINPPGGVPYQTMLGQWNMHFVRADYAWGYGALGTGQKIAVIDTGVDTTHPELAGKIGYTACFVTGATPATGTDVSDLDGHGTDVAGIAAENTNNAFGFASVGYNAQLWAYKVFPNPPAAGCAPASTDPACGSDPVDVASAIEDAISQHVNVINLSLGSPVADTAEENAVADAIANNIVVVAAAGNFSPGDTAPQNTLYYPAADPGVIAVGATALNDTQSQTSPAEYVSSYSHYGTTARWGLVAPGGDPTPCEYAVSNPCNANYLHWIENIYSSQAGSPCSNDINGGSECKILISGTSQAAPHVAGAAALLLGAGVVPANIFTVLCNTADPVTGTMLPANGTTLPAAAAGCGRLDIYRAMANATGDPNPPGPGGNLNS